MATLRLIVNLTQPAFLCFNASIPEDKTTRKFYLEVIAQLQCYKEAFADTGILGVLSEKLASLLEKTWEDRQEDDRLVIERILILIRNILHVPVNPEDEQRTDDDASIHDQILWAMHASGLEDLLLYIGGSDDEHQFALHALEVISLMFREQKPEALAR
ncbi:PREDICTED: protein timeless homolog, partial [Priapulus caudatus]|uniref:Protein timeless homolog n=1 Tax=Priapulus caudatus TaxID=37621 RepID=A0ABM1ECH6_PRICU